MDEGILDGPSARRLRELQDSRSDGSDGGNADQDPDGILTGIEPVTAAESAPETAPETASSADADSPQSPVQGDPVASPVPDVLELAESTDVQEGEDPVATAEAAAPEVAPEAATDARRAVLNEDAAEASADAAQGQPGMQHLMRDFDRDYRSPQRGDVLDGIVVSIDKDGIMVDVGTKSEGIISGHELQNLGPEALEQVKVGDEVVVYVVQPENSSGHVVLSLSRARAEKGWRAVQKQFDEGKAIQASVVDFNRGGLIVDLDGLRGFVPISQVVGLRHDSAGEGEFEGKMAGMVGRLLYLKIIEVNRGRNRLILSERAAVQEMRAVRKEQLLGELQEAEIRHGRVTSICDFGAFVDLGGADGLVHLSELSWGQVSHPSQVVQVGDEVDVYVLGVDREKKKIALSLRRSQPGPWARIAEKYKVGDLVSGTITKLASFGAFARIEDGVEGLIHVSELGEGRIPHPRSVVKEGDSLTLRVIRIDPARRRLGLSLRQAQGHQDDVGVAAARQETDDGTPEAVRRDTCEDVQPDNPEGPQLDIPEDGHCDGPEECQSDRPEDDRREGAGAESMSGTH